MSRAVLGGHVRSLAVMGGHVLTWLIIRAFGVLIYFYCCHKVSCAVKEVTGSTKNTSAVMGGHGRSCADIADNKWSLVLKFVSWAVMGYNQLSFAVIDDHRWLFALLIWSSHELPKSSQKQSKKVSGDTSRPCAVNGGHGRSRKVMCGFVRSWAVMCWHG